MIEQKQGGSNSEQQANQQHFLSDIDDFEEVDDGDDSDVVEKHQKEISARRKVEDLLEERRLKQLTKDFDFDDFD